MNDTEKYSWMDFFFDLNLDYLQGSIISFIVSREYNRAIYLIDNAPVSYLKKRGTCIYKDFENKINRVLKENNDYSIDKKMLASLIMFVIKRNYPVVRDMISYIDDIFNLQSYEEN